MRNGRANAETTGNGSANRVLEMNVPTLTSALPGQETLIASWRALAEASPGATVITTPGAIAAVFPEWAALNNAIALEVPDGVTTALAAAEVSHLYGAAGVDTWALWIPSAATDLDAPDALRTLGDLKRDTTTLVMRAGLTENLRSHGAVVRTSVSAAPLAGDEPLDPAELPGPDPGSGIEGWALVHDGMAIAGAWSCIHGHDCGIYAVGTVPEWRRRGFARALVEHVLADAGRRGARTTTVQATRMGQPLYESLGYVAAGRYEEWVSR
jgi:ribosomal protein S18 acetylase RimI-like enzyme